MRIRVKSAVIDIEVEGEDAKACFEQMASAQEAFGSTICGSCDSPNTVFVSRKNGKYQFYEMRCQECFCTLSMSQRTEDGALYPRRKDRDGNRLENNGWVKYRPKDETPF